MIGLSLPPWCHLPTQSPVLILSFFLFFRTTRHTLALRSCLRFLSPGTLWPQMSALLCHPNQVWFTFLFFSMRLSLTILLKIAHLLPPSSFLPFSPIAVITITIRHTINFICFFAICFSLLGHKFHESKNFDCFTHQISTIPGPGSA